jgi:short-subunit dehydrogenase
MQFDNRYVLVTGASSGIGTVFSREFARLGAKLIITARREDRLNSLKMELEETFNSEVHCISCDLAQPGAASELLGKIDTLGFPVDVLVNNAGFGYLGDFETCDSATSAGMMQLNMVALTELMHGVLPGMKSRRYGGIINVASMAGFTAIPYFAVYAATKAYVIHLSEAVWKELHGTGVHVTALCPGPVSTEFFDVSGYNPSGPEGRTIQTSGEVVQVGIRALAKNIPVAPTSVMLKLLSKVQSVVPRRLSLNILALNMKKSRNN